jgi:response regulator RpfG family c-di-GMP phosphodiesterase
VKRNFLIAASDGQVREDLARDLRANGYSVTLASDGSAAMRVVRGVTVDAVLIESHLPDMTAEQLKIQIQQLRPECRVVVLSGFEKVRNTPDQLRFGAEDYILGREQISDLLRAPFEAGSDASGTTSGQRGHEALIEVIDVLIGLRELDDRYFGGGSHQATKLARTLAQQMSADDETVQEIVLSTLLRDIGNVGIASEVLEEDGRYSADQKSRMQEHVSSSVRLLEHIDFPWKVLPIIRHHHEWYDGSGYPDGLRGREIPIGARIVSAVDAYVAMTSPRRHRSALEPHAAVRELVRGAGHQFDPEVVERLQRLLEDRLAQRTEGDKPLVLIAEPQNDLRKLLKIRLVNEGLVVKEVASYERALGLMLKLAPRLVLADLDADVDRAFQLLNEIREDPTLNHQAFAFLTRQTDRVLKMRALREGVDDFLYKTVDMDELVARVQNILTRESLRKDGGRRRRSGISGSIQELGLPDLVQMLVIGMKTARVSLRSGRRRGKIWFENGTPKHAACGELQGEAAFYEMVRWQTGQFVIRHGVKIEEATLKRDGMFLLMEGLRLMDEDAKNEATAAS